MKWFDQVGYEEMRELIELKEARIISWKVTCEKEEIIYHVIYEMEERY